MDEMKKRPRRPLDGPVRQVKTRSKAPDDPDVLSLDSIKIDDDSGDNDNILADDQPIFVYDKRQTGGMSPRLATGGRQPQLKKNMWNPRNWGWRRWILTTCLAAVLAAGGWFGYLAISNIGKIIKQSNGHAFALSGSTDVAKLKGEGDGRVNILLLGIGGGTHEGGQLSDTMMVVSLDPKTKDVAMLSIPRDLYVKINNSYGKINQASSDGGPLLAEKVVEKVIGVPVHYYVKLDFSGFKQMVDAVGGIDITVKSALSDPEYPCDSNQYRSCGYYQPAGQFHMNGAQALKYARCRKGTCGLDFGRAARQQEVLLAIRQKTLQLSTLTNPAKITALINAIGDHVQTDLQLDEINKLAGIAKDVNAAKIVNKVLNTDDDNYLVFGPSSLNAGSVEVPKAGLFNYSDIHDFVKNIFVDHYITGENALIEVQNGTGRTGVAATLVNSLKMAHYNVLPAATASAVTAKTVIYDYTNGKKPYTVKYLETRFGVTAVKAKLPSASPTTGAATATAPEIRIILGSDYQKTSNTTNSNSSD